MIESASIDLVYIVSHFGPACNLSDSLILPGNHIGEAKEYAFEKHSDLKYVNGYDDVEICAGAGSMGVEILGVYVPLWVPCMGVHILLFRLVVDIP